VIVEIFSKRTVAVLKYLFILISSSVMSILEVNDSVKSLEDITIRMTPNPMVKHILMRLALISGFNTILNPINNNRRPIINSNSPRNPNRSI